MTPSPPVIDYAPAKPKRMRKLVLRICLPVGLVIIALLILGKYFTPYIHQAQYMWLQYRCMNHEKPANMVVYSEEASDIATLSTKPNYRLYDWPPNPAPPGWVTPIYYAQRLDRELGWNGSDSPLFLHERRSPAGHERLVGLGFSIFESSSSAQHDIHLCYGTGIPATWSLGSKVFQNSFLPQRFVVLAGERLRLYAAQPDPADGAHFTMAYEINGVPGVIDGWLLDDEHLNFEIRSGPAVGRLRRK